MLRDVQSGGVFGLVKLRDRNGTIANFIESMRNFADMKVGSADQFLDYFQELRSVQPITVRFDNTGKYSLKLYTEQYSYSFLR